MLMHRPLLLLVAWAFRTRRVATSRWPAAQLLVRRNVRVSGEVGYDLQQARAALPPAR